MRTAISAGVILALSLCAWPARSQVTPDGSLGTEVEQQGHTFEIRGGELSGDGANLFHSFDRFDLTDEQTAQFMTPPEAQNVLGRVTGGGASTIDGLIQVIGSNADLFLMNPAGIVFGENAQLNVAGDFTATTASGIEFESGWFEAIGAIEGSAFVGDLVGEPTTFDFSGDGYGAIVNLGDLQVAEGSGLNLLGGTVVNTGNLTGDRIQIAAIEGGQMVRLSTADNVLSLEVAADRVSEAGIGAIALPELLTSGEVAGATELVVVDGVVQLRELPIGVGDVALVDSIESTGIYSLVAPEVAVFATGDVVLGSNGIEFGETLDNVTFISDLDKSEEGSIYGGARFVSVDGNIEIVGFQIDTDYLDSGYLLNETREEFVDVPQSGNINITAHHDLRLGEINNNAVQQAGDITLSIGGSMRVEGYIQAASTEGNGGDIAITTSGSITVGGDLNANGTQQAGDITLLSNGALEVGEYIQSFSDEGIGGDINITAAESITIGDSVDSFGGQDGGNIKIDSATGNVSIASSLSSYGTQQAGDITLLSNGALEVGEYIQSFSDEGIGGDINITAAESITIGDSVDSFGGQDGGNIKIDSATGNVSIASSLSSYGTQQAGEYIQSFSDEGIGGDINITAAESITIGDSVDSFGGQDGGNIKIDSATGNVSIASSLLSYGTQQAGDITLLSNGALEVGEYIQSFSDEGIGGDINITAAESITIGDSVDSFGGQDGGNIKIDSATGNVSIASYLSSYSLGGNAGNIEILAPQGAVSIGRELETYAAQNAGLVRIEAGGDIQIGAEFDQSINDISNEEGFDPNLWATVQTYTDSSSGEAGDITLNSTNGNIRLDRASYVDASGQTLTLASVRSNGALRSGDLNLTATGNLTAGEIITQAGGGDSGQITINGNNVTAGNVSSIGVTSSGSIGLSSTGSIVSGNVTTTASAGRSGNISVDAQVDAILRNLRSEGGTGSGNINVNALRNIITGDITSKAIQGNSGNVTLNAGGDITTGDIASIADNGTSGNITLDAGGSISTGTLTTADGTISVTSGAGDGDSGENTSGEVSVKFEEVENRHSEEFLNYLGVTPMFEGGLAETEATIAALSAERGIRTASVFIELLPDEVLIRLSDPDGETLVAHSAVDRDTVLSTIDTYRNHLVNARYRLLGQHNTYAAQLYDWLIRPIAPELEARDIHTLMFSVDGGLRSLPFAALYDGQQYLVEQYSYSLIPSLGLVDPRYQPLQSDAPMLAMGASEFTNLAPLPGVPVELDTLINYRRDGTIVLNEAFTRENIIQTRNRTPYPIVHLATHGEFNAGSLENSYLQLWDDRIGLDEIRELGWHDPAVELLVLSACQTALGSAEAEMGFAGLAVAAGVKTAIASLWYVDDSATFMLMTELYNHLATAPIKAEALRAAQLALMSGDVRIEDGQLYAGDTERIALPESLAGLEGQDFSHPYYWSAFTAIGAPW